MSQVGLYCENSELLLEIETAFHLARLKGMEDGAAADCELRCLTSLPRDVMPRDGMPSRGMTPDCALRQEQIPFLILACATAERTFAAAEALWSENPALSIICVAQQPEEVFAALPHPFFHVVRRFCLEQDLRAVLCKIARAGPLLPRRCTFQGKSGLVRIPLKEILYLESDRHAIRVHTLPRQGQEPPEETGFFTTESLSQCEERLRALGFARIHKSYLVNLYHVAKLEKERLTLDCGRQLYISRHRYPEVKLQFEHYIRHLDFL